MKKSTKILSLLLALALVFSLAMPVGAIASAGKQTSTATLVQASAKSISKCKITVASSVAYTGKALKPKVTVKYGSKTLKSGTHYTVKYSSNTKIGTASVTVTGVKKNGYTGSKKLTFKIVPKQPTVKVSATTTSSIKLTWSKVSGAKTYTVYRYDGKKYVKIGSTTSTSYTNKKLTAGKTYYYKVTASTVVSKKTYTSDYSSKVTASTNPAKVTSLKATATSNTVKLTWAKVSGASTYTVYSYNSSTKKYTKVASGVKSNTYTVSKLKSQTSYSYAVEAVRTVGKTSYVGAKSSVVTVKTDVPAEWLDTLEECYSVMRSGTFSIKMTDQDFQDMEVDTTVHVKDGKLTMSAVIPMEELMGDASEEDIKQDAGNSGISVGEISDIKMYMFYSQRKKKYYAIMNAFGLKLYMEMSDKEAAEMKDSLNAKTFIDALAPEKDAKAKITKATVTADGKKYTCESYVAKNGATVKYYFYNHELVKIEVIAKDGTSNAMQLSGLSKTVDKDVMFDVPVTFPLGYISLDSLA